MYDAVKAQEFVSGVYEEIRAALGGRIRTRDERRREKNAKRAQTQPFESGREPRALSTTLRLLAKQQGWDAELEKQAIVDDWAEVVGPGIASHTKVVAIEDGQILVQSDSTSWATELRRLSAVFVTAINERYPAAKIEYVKVLAPGTVSWRHGPRSVPGRGPRDTYG